MGNNSDSKQKVFLVFNTACFGDVLVCNSLCQNIKLAYPDSRIVFVCDKNFYEAAKYQKDVDEVVIFDKKGEHKGFSGLCRFLKNFKYKRPYASFITYPNQRNCFIAKMLGSKYVIQGKNFLKSEITTQEQHVNLLKKITKHEPQNLPIKYIVEDTIPSHLSQLITKDEKYIGLCSLTKNPPKNMPITTAAGIIKEINRTKTYKVIFFGVGKDNEEYAKELENLGCEFINLVNKTTVYELAQVLKNCKALISTDTGTMHLGYSVGIPTVAVFYEIITLKNWTPNPKLYKCVTISSNQTVENIMAGLKFLLNKEKRISVVIPTLQKNKELLINLLSTLEQDKSVDEILLIDNSLQGLDYTNSKLRTIIPNENMYVNPSWNFGVKEARNDIVALLNDDITITSDFCSRVAEEINPNMGCVGFNIDNIRVTHEIQQAIGGTKLCVEPSEYRGNHWGIAIFFYKSSYLEIPNDLKIFCGDDWIFMQSKKYNRQNYQISGQDIYHYGSLTSASKSLSAIGDKDRALYRRYTRKWWNYIFNVEPVFRGVRITVLGIELLCHYTNKH